MPGTRGEVGQAGVQGLLPLTSPWQRGLGGQTAMPPNSGVIFQRPSPGGLRICEGNESIQRWRFSVLLHRTRPPRRARAWYAPRALM